MTNRRRTVLAAIGAGAALAGCLGGVRGGDGGDSRAGGDGNGDDGGDEDAETLGTHPASRGLDDQPSLGEADAPATVVAFEDPSCPTCRKFERGAGARLREGPVADGRLRFVVRTYPIIYPWGEPATQALEATYARDADAFWGLFDHYFAQQGSFDGENVLPRTRDWLADNTDLDADEVVADARTEAYDDAVQADLDAGEAAGANRTPTLFLFSDGTYRTRASGSVSYETVALALEL
ncbi:thioredoxin domain-containing protein [Halorarum halophilum]|uniref:Thioredoxin domain-containing protein n=1 Tax=Halorarum halophilum TaxID=2743090 RepID=A0A7D5KW42_9EURY|nr:thioredoxin domain-containing protein [Halobaculum halophilum]QLG26058.1 thioredoxin domain-containing protein [Halobaculum halophilum]